MPERCDAYPVNSLIVMSYGCDTVMLYWCSPVQSPLAKCDIDIGMGRSIDADIGVAIDMDVNIGIAIGRGIDIGIGIDKDIGKGIGIDTGIGIGTDIGIDIGDVHKQRARF